MVRAFATPSAGHKEIWNDWSARDCHCIWLVPRVTVQAVPKDQQVPIYSLWRPCWCGCLAASQWGPELALWAFSSLSLQSIILPLFITTKPSMCHFTMSSWLTLFTQYGDHSTSVARTPPSTCPFLKVISGASLTVLAPELWAGPFCPPFQVYLTLSPKEQRPSIWALHCRKPKLLLQNDPSSSKDRFSLWSSEADCIKTDF